jgi:MoxR-like ATPase
MAEVIQLCKQSKVTLFMWGIQGIGKSTSVKQFCQSEAIRGGLNFKDGGPFSDEDYGFVDFRCSQIEAADLRGLPDRVGGKTVYLPPSDLPTKGQGVLFLDELNRAEDDVLQAAFQLVLDRKIGTYTLPEGWSVVVAGNYSEGFNVNNFSDPAFIDRFCHVDLTTGENYFRDWVDFMTDAHGAIAQHVVQFVSVNEDMLTGKQTGQKGFERMPSPRSWDAVARVYTAHNSGDYHYTSEAYETVLRGLVGAAMAAAFLKFTIKVHPDDIISKGVKAVEKDLRKLKRGNMVSIMWGLCSKALKLTKQTDDHKKKRANVLDFMEWSLNSTKDKDMSVMMARQLVMGETTDIGTAVITSPKIAKLVEQFKDKKGMWGGWIGEIRQRPKLAETLSNFSWYGKAEGKTKKGKKK